MNREGFEIALRSYEVFGKRTEPSGDLIYGVAPTASDFRGWLHYVCRPAPEDKLQDLLAHLPALNTHPHRYQLLNFNGAVLYEGRLKIYGTQVYPLDTVAYPYDWIVESSEKAELENILNAIVIGSIKIEKSKLSILQRKDESVFLANGFKRASSKVWHDLDEFLVDQISSLG